MAAQEPSLYFERINTQHGLSHDKVNCILQDKRGFMWFGTDDGLNRYDGKNFFVFKNIPGDSTSITGNIITGILQDGEEVMWIATADGGLCRYDYRLPPPQQFRQYRHRPGDTHSMPGNIINDIIDDGRGSLWLATSGHSILRFNKQTGVISKPVQRGSKRTILALCMDSHGMIWAGGQGGGLLKLNPVSLALEEDERYYDLYASLPHASVTSLFMDKDQHIWFGSWDNVLYRYHAQEKREEIFKRTASPYSYQNDEATCFVQDNQGRIWIGGKEQGLQVYDGETGRFYRYRTDPSKEGSLAANRIHSLYMGRDGLVWIGTDRGISISSPFRRLFMQTFLPILQPENGRETVIYDYFEADDFRLWIGTSEGIFIREHDGSFSHRPLAHKGQKLAVTCFYREDAQHLLLGTDYTLFRYHMASGRLTVLPDKSRDAVMYPIIDSRVVSVLRDSIGHHPVFLVSPYGHYITYYDITEEKWVSRLDTAAGIIKRFNLKDNLVRKFVRTKDGTLWLATAKTGLGMWKKGNAAIKYFHNIPGQEGTIANNNITDIAEDRKGNLWVSTYGGGLHYFDTRLQVFRHIPSSNNLVEGLAIDHYGHVWMTSNGHLQKYDPSKNAITRYELPDLEKSGGVRNGIFRGKDGILYLSGRNYFIGFHPDSIRGRQVAARAQFTDFTIFNQSFSHVLFSGRIRLSHRKNYFTINFSAPEFYGGPVQYSYKMDGFDKDWIRLGTRNYVSYSNLRGGDYVFRVRASDTPGTWGGEEATLAITIIPPLWQQWWFYGVCALTIALLVYSFYRYRIKELIKRQAIRDRIAQDLHDSMGSTLSSISVYSQVAKVYKQKNQDEDLQDTLEKIGTTSGEMISEMNDIVWAINPRNDSMEKIVQRMESFARPLLQTRNIRFSLAYDSSLLSVNLPMEKRKNFYLIFKEAVNNAFKYAECTNLGVFVGLVSGNIELKVQDDGKGFDTMQMNEMETRSLSGNGLYNMRRRAAEMKGTCSIESAPGQGTSVILRFPIT